MGRHYRDNPVVPPRLIVIALLASLLAAAPANATSLVRRDGVADARRWAAARAGSVAFAVADERGRIRGLARHRRFASASLSKAMLLVAALRAARGRRLTAAERAMLHPMVTRSDNAAAWDVYRHVGGGLAVSAVARAAGMRRFVEVGWWSDEQVTAADQARLFARINRLVPRAHRRYARRLLSSIEAGQRWGIAAVAARLRLRAFFKGGWRSDVVHQAALLEHGRRRVALAVLSQDPPGHVYATATIEGITARVLRRPRPPYRRAALRQVRADSDA